MKLKKTLSHSLLVSALALGTAAQAAELEVTHWWTSGGEANAVAELANAVNASQDTWLDGAIAGSSGVAIPLITSRIIGGEPMAATQLNHGRQAEELIEAGLMTDLTAIAEAEGWKDYVNPTSLLDSCTFEGRIYCVPLNIHSTQWLWLSHAAYETAGVPVPTDWSEFVASAPKLRAKGIVPLAMGQQSWQTQLAFEALSVAMTDRKDWFDVYNNRNTDVLGGAEFDNVFAAYDQARKLAAGSDVQDWNQATAMVINGKAGGQIHGDWAQGEFAVAGQVAGKDYTCLPGMGNTEVLNTGGDAFYFPVIDDPAIKAAQLRMASLLMSKEVQVAFNLKKGSLPVRSDVDLGAANDCMQKGLKILAAGNILPNLESVFSPDTKTQLDDLTIQFWSDMSMSADELQAEYVKVIADAD